MKRKKIKNLTLKKKSISNLQVNSITGKGTLCLTEICIYTTVAISLLKSCVACSDGCNGGIP